MSFKVLLSVNLLLLVGLVCVNGDIRSTLVSIEEIRILSQTFFSSVYELVEARSGVKSNCTWWTSYFSTSGTVRSPVGSQPVVGPAAIQKHCETWNDNLGPQGNGWYPLELWSGGNEVILYFQLDKIFSLISLLLSQRFLSKQQFEQ